MDWGILFGGLSAGIMLVGTISGFVYLIMRLTTNPIKEDVEELKGAVLELTKTVNKLAFKVKTDEEIQRIVDLRIANHVENCPKRNKE